MQADEKFKAQAEATIDRRVSLWGDWTDDRPFHSGTLVKAGDDLSEDPDDGYCFLIDFDDDEGLLLCPVKDFNTITVWKEQANAADQ